jgi:protein-S-isoprenylcysteine O-methyltransferase Ste14
MSSPVRSILNTIIFTVLVPGSVSVLGPYLLLQRSATLALGPLTLLGLLGIGFGAAIYFRCAWEFAVRGLGTPAPIAPTKYLVTTALHRQVRNPMYIGVFLVLIGEAALFRSLKLLLYAGLFCMAVELFVLYYEEPTLQRQFGESYEEYKRSVPRWIPKFK